MTKKIHKWYGQPIDTLSKEELLEVIDHILDFHEKRLEDKDSIISIYSLAVKILVNSR